MNIVFMGTPDFSVPSFKAMIENFNVIAAFTQPDRPKGRGKKLAMSPVKEVALENNIPVYQPERIKKQQEYIDKLKELQPDYIIVVAYGQILPKEVLEIPKYACINLHASLLPKLRGAAPINWAIINGEKISGNTTMVMDVGMDTGDMLLKDEVEITENMTSGVLHDILMERGAALLVKTINGYTEKTIERIKQDETLSTYAPMLNKETCIINWSNSAEQIHNLIRGLNPKPTAMTTYEDTTIKIYESKVVRSSNNKYTPGEIIQVTKDGIEVATGNNNLLLTVIQMPGKKPLEVKEFLKGNNLENGKILK